MEIIVVIRAFITYIYRFAMHILDFFDEPMKLEYSRSQREDDVTCVSQNNNLDNSLDLDSILDDIIKNSAQTDNSSNKYTPLYFDNLSYSDFVNTEAAQPPSYFGGNNSYMNDLFFATTNDETLDINRPFFDENIETRRDGVGCELIVSDDDMPDLVSISSDENNTNNITPLVAPQDDADDFVSSEPCVDDLADAENM